jgi:splicing factor 3A subunit 2
MDFQNRAGGKTGGGGVATAQQDAIDRRERLRQLALETIDITKDPYFMRNHVGQYECKLCLTIHPNEGHYLAHTQAKRHQQNLARRAAMDAREKAVLPQPAAQATAKRKGIRIGRPGYRVVKQRDPETGQRSLLFEIEYPEIEEGLQPRHRFMSAFEQKVEAPDKDWQYLLFAAEPYETIAFKLPSWEVDRAPGKFATEWNPVKRVFSLQVHFVEKGAAGSGGAAGRR